MIKQISSENIRHNNKGYTRNLYSDGTVKWYDGENSNANYEYVSKDNDLEFIYQKTFKDTFNNYENNV